MSQQDASGALQRAEATCRALIERTAEILQWEWDGRFDAALAAVKAPQDSDVLERLAEQMPQSWGSGELAGAPASVQQAAKSWGGLMAGQKLFAGNVDDEPLLFCAWWPWGNKTTFSLRVSFYSANPETAATGSAQLRSWFGV